MADFDPFRDSGAVALDEPQFDPFKAGAVPVDDGFDPFKSGAVPLDQPVVVEGGPMQGPGTDMTGRPVTAKPVTPEQQKFRHKAAIAQQLLPDFMQVNTPEQLAALDATGTARSGVESIGDSISQGRINLDVLKGIGSPTPGEVDAFNRGDFDYVDPSRGKPIVELPKPTKDAVIPQFIAGIADVADSLTTEENLALLAGVGAAPKAIQKIASAGFAVQMTKGGIEQILADVPNETAGQKTRRLTGAVASLLLGGLAGKHALERPATGGGARPESLPQQTVDRAITQNQLENLRPTETPLSREVQAANPDVVDGLVLARERLTDEFNTLPEEMRAERQASIDDIDAQLLQMDRGAVQAAEARVRERGLSKAQAEPAAPPDATGGPPENTGRSKLFEQARNEAAKEPEQSGEVSPPSTKEVEQRIRSAYDALIQEKGFPAVPIQDVIDRAGVPAEIAKEYLADTAKSRTVLSRGDWSIASPREREGVIRTQGEDKLQVRFIDNALEKPAISVAKTPNEAANEMQQFRAKAIAEAERSGATDAEGAVQEAMAELSARPDKLVNAEAQLISASKNKARNQLDAANAIKRGGGMVESIDAPRGESEQSLAEAMPAPEPARAFDAEAQGVIDRAELTPSERRIVDAVKGGEYESVAEAADALGISRQAASESFNSALGKLRSMGPGAASAYEPLARYELRRFGERFGESEDIAPEIRDASGNRYYEVLPNRVTAEEAARIVNDRGIDESIRSIRDETADITPAVRSTIGQQVIKRLNEQYKSLKETNPVEAEKVLDKTVDLAEWQMEYGTRLGQGVQSFAMWSRLTPEGQLKSYKRSVNKARNRVDKETDGDVSKITKAAKESESKVRDEMDSMAAEVRKEKALEKAIENAKNPPKQRGEEVTVDSKRVSELKKELSEVRKAMAEKRKNEPARVAERKERMKLAREDALQKDSDKIADQLSDTPTWPGKKTPDAARELIRKHLKEPQEEFQKRLVELGAKESTAAEIDRMAKELSDTPSWGKTQSNDLQKLLNKNSREIVPDFVQQVKRLGVSEKTANEIENISSENRRRISAINRQKRIDALRDRLLKDKNKTAKRLKKSTLEKIIDLSDDGLLKEENVWDAVSKDLGLPDYSPETVMEITRLSTEIQNASEGIPKQEATLALTKYLSSKTGFKPSDLPLGIYYGNMLSGYNTHIVNALDTGLNVMSEVATMGIQHPTKIADLFRGVIRGLGEAKPDALLALSEGRRVVDGKFVETPGLMEASKFGQKGGVPISKQTRTGRVLKSVAESKLAKPLNAYKYVGRLMAASDTVFYRAAQEAKAALLALREAEAGGLSGKEARAVADSILGYDKIDQFRAQAKSEGFTGPKAEARASELMMQSRPEKLREESADYAGLATYNHKPEGLLGYFAEKAGEVTNRLPVLKLVLPFTRIVANVTNRGLDWTPYGYKRAIWGRTFGEKMMGEARNAELAKATLGTIGLAGLAVLNQTGAIQIHGGGPSDTERKRQLQAAGWKPYTIQIGDTYMSYLPTPMGLGISTLGNYLDANRYQEMRQKDSLTRTTYAVSRIASTVFNQSFLSGLSDIFSALSSKQPGEQISKLKQIFTRTASTLVVPNLAKDLNRFFDPSYRDSNSIAEDLVRDIPMIRLTLDKSLNAYGDPVSQPRNRFVSQRKSEPEWRIVVDKNLRIPVADETTFTTPEAGHEYQRIAGQKMKQYVLNNLSRLKNMTDDQAQEAITDASHTIFSSARSTIRSRYPNSLRQRK